MNKKHLLLLILTVGFTLICEAQPTPPGGGPQPDCWPPPCVPIDGGISLLIAAGAIYGGKKLFTNQKENSL